MRFYVIWRAFFVDVLRSNFFFAFILTLSFWVKKFSSLPFIFVVFFLTYLKKSKWQPPS